VNNELGRMWKETLVTSSKVLPKLSLERIGKQADNVKFTEIDNMANYTNLNVSSGLLVSGQRIKPGTSQIRSSSVKKHTAVFGGIHGITSV
jgi:hypothetical protein